MNKEIPTAFAVVMKMIAKVPDEQRRYIIRDVFKEFAKMPDEKRMESIELLIRAKADLDNREREALVKSKMESLAEYFDDKERMKLFATHINTLLELPEEMKADDITMTFKVINRLNEKNKKANLEAIKALFNEAPAERREKMLNILPEEGKRLLAL